MGHRLALVTSSPEGTRALGSALAEILGPGDVLSLTGDLGAGKTTFVQGVAAGLDVTEPVLSPTFTLVREYEGRQRVFHMDVYRLDRIQDVLDLGFEEMLDEGAVVFVEWGDAIEALLPQSHLQVELTLSGDGEADDAVRRIELAGEGESWALRWERLEQVTSPWRTD